MNCVNNKVIQYGTFKFRKLKSSFDCRRTHGLIEKDTILHSACCIPQSSVLLGGGEWLPLSSVTGRLNTFGKCWGKTCKIILSAPTFPLLSCSTDGFYYCWIWSTISSVFVPTLNPQDEAHVVIKPHYCAAWCAQRREGKHLIQSIPVLYTYFLEMCAIQWVKDNKVLKDVPDRIQEQLLVTHACIWCCPINQFGQSLIYFGQRQQSS